MECIRVIHEFICILRRIESEFHCFPAWKLLLLFLFNNLMQKLRFLRILMEYLVEYIRVPRFSPQNTFPIKVIIKNSCETQFSTRKLRLFIPYAARRWCFLWIYWSAESIYKSCNSIVAMIIDAESEITRLALFLVFLLHL